MKYNPEIHDRRSIRLNGYDYSQAGLYFITICTDHRLCLFGGNVGAGSKPAQPAQMVLNDAGMMVQNQWRELTHLFKNTKLHEFIVMHNHIHGTIETVSDETSIDQNVVSGTGQKRAGLEPERAGLEPAPTDGVVGKRAIPCQSGIQRGGRGNGLRIKSTMTYHIYSPHWDRK